MAHFQSRLDKLERSIGVGGGKTIMVLVPGSWRVNEEPPNDLLDSLLAKKGIEPKPIDTVIYVRFVRPSIGRSRGDC